MSLIDLENLQDKRCIEKINENFFSRHFRAHRNHDVFDYKSLQRTIDYMRGIYGQESYHPGFGKLMGDMLTDDSLEVNENGFIRYDILAKRMIELHLSGIIDKTFNMYIRKLFHNYSRALAN